MTRRTALLLLFALATIPGSGCYHLRNCIARFRACHGCCPTFANPCDVGCAPAPGCATCYSGPPAAPAGPYPAAMFGMPQPLPAAPQVDSKTGAPLPMK